MQQNDDNDYAVRQGVLYPQRKRRTIDRIIQHSESVLGRRQQEQAMRTTERKPKVQSNQTQKDYESSGWRAAGIVKSSQVGQESAKKHQRTNSVLPQSK